MPSTQTTRLRIFTDEQLPPSPPESRDLGLTDDVLDAFQCATGWSLKYVSSNPPSQSDDLTWSPPANPGVGNPSGHLRLDPVGSPETGGIGPAGRDGAKQLAAALVGLLGKLDQARSALRRREAELAVGSVPPSRSQGQAHLADSLEAALRAGAEGIGCNAAALYLLDDPTTHLKLRASWGLLSERFTEPPRPLQGALADLEALLGHAVVLENAEITRHFNSPEDFPAAVCVPVSSATNILGTLWVFSAGPRDFTDRQTNVVELTAGRIAAELERETLLAEALRTADLRQQLAAADRMQRNQLPSVPPLVDGWDVAGWTAQAQTVGGDFFDWFGLSDGLVGVAVGDVMERGIEAALSASIVRTALRCHGQYLHDVDALLRQVNLTLWRGSAGDQFASIFCGLLETATGRVRWCQAGEPAVILIRPDGWESLSCHSPPLGVSPEADYPARDCILRPGEALAVFTDGFRDVPNTEGQPLSEAGLAEPLRDQLDASAEELVALARRRLDRHATSPGADDRTLLVVKRTAS